MRTTPKEAAPKKTARKSTTKKLVSPRSSPEDVVRLDALSPETSDGVDDVGQEMAATFLENATGADDAAMEHRAAVLPEEIGGPFVITTASQEYAEGTDESNPADAEREPFPKV